MNKLAARLKNARERKELKQIDVQNITGINNKTLSNYEHGVSSPDPETIKTLALLYNVSADYLLGIDDDITNNKFNNYSINEHQKKILQTSDELDPEYQVDLKKYAELLKIKQSIERNKNSESSASLTDDA